jgi:hypothetical protein
MTSALILSMVIVLAADSMQAFAFADDQARVEAALDHLGQACKDKLMTRFPDVPMSDLHVTVGTSFKEGLDKGSIGLEDLQKSGAFYEIEVPGKGSGACGVNAQGKITEFSISKN